MCIAALAGGAAAQSQPAAIAGRVVDAQGEPVAGADVSLAWRQHPELPLGLEAPLGDPAPLSVDTKTDDRGEFRLEVPGAWPMTLYAHRAAGEYSDLVFPALPGDFHELRLVEARRFAAHVAWVGDARQPIANALVDLRWFPPPKRDEVLPGFDLAAAAPWLTFTTETSQDGGFALDVPRSGATELGVRLGYGAHRQRNLQPIELAPPTTVQLAFHRSGISLPRARAIDRARPSVVHTADDEGIATVTRIGTQPILLLHERHVPQIVDIEGGGRRTVGMRRCAQVRATLATPDGAPLRDARVLLARPFAAETARHYVQVIGWADRTDDHGQIRAGLSSEAPLMLFAEVGDRFVYVALRYPEVEPVEDVDLGTVRLSAAHRIVGHVLAADRAPAAGAWVFVRPELPDGEALDSALEVPLSRVTVADRGGRFSVDGLMPGRYVVAVRARGNAVARRTTVAQRRPEPMHFELEPARTVRGTVFDQTDHAVAGAMVILRQDPRHVPGRLHWGGSLFQASMRTDSRGHFAFEDVPDGVALMLVAHRNLGGRAERSILLDVPTDGESQRITLTPQ